MGKRRNRHRGKAYQHGPFQYRIRQIHTITGATRLGDKWYTFQTAERLTTSANATPGALLYTIEYPPMEKEDA